MLLCLHYKIGKKLLKMRYFCINQIKILILKKSHINQPFSIIFAKKKQPGPQGPQQPTILSTEKGATKLIIKSIETWKDGFEAKKGIAIPLGASNFMDIKPFFFFLKADIKLNLPEILQIINLISDPLTSFIYLIINLAKNNLLRWKVVIQATSFSLESIIHSIFTMHKS